MTIQQQINKTIDDLQKFESSIIVIQTFFNIPEFTEFKHVSEDGESGDPACMVLTSSEYVVIIDYYHAEICKLSSHSSKTFYFPKDRTANYSFPFSWVNTFAQLIEEGTITM